MINQNTHTHSAVRGEYPAHLVSWRSVAAGFLVSLLTMAALVGLGMALGGIGIDENLSVQGASIFTGLWFLGSTIISIFVGSFYSARLASYGMPKIGAANGLLIAGLFIVFFLIQVFNTIGSIGRGAGALAGAAGQAATEAGEMASQNSGSVSMVTNYVEEQFIDLDLRSSPQVVASGMATRLLNGNTEGAQNYLAYQANIDPEDAQARVAEFSAQVDSLVEEATEAASTTMQSTGWSLFLLIVSSAIAAALGGFMGTRRISPDSASEDLSRRRDFSDRDLRERDARESTENWQTDMNHLNNHRRISDKEEAYKNPDQPKVG